MISYTINLIPLNSIELLIGEAVIQCEESYQNPTENYFYVKLNDICILN